MSERLCDKCDDDAVIFYGSNYGNQKFCRKHGDKFHRMEQKRHARQTKKDGGPWPQMCPRRAEVGAERAEQLAGPTDHWAYGHGIITPLPIPTCTYCGGVQPRFVIERVQDEGWWLERTTKGYKAYLHAPGHGSVGKVYFMHFTHEDIDALNAALAS